MQKEACACTIVLFLAKEFTQTLELSMLFFYHSLDNSFLDSLMGMKYHTTGITSRPNGHDEISWIMIMLIKEMHFISVAGQLISLTFTQVYQ